MVRRPKVQDLAHKAKVSVATVSRILNGSARVSAELHERVRKAALEMGVSLQDSTRSRTVAFVLGNRHMLHLFHSRILAGAQEYCSAHGWDTIYLPFNYQPNSTWKDLNFPQVLRRRDVVRAVILCGTNSENLLLAFKQRGMPFAAFGNTLLIEESEHKNYDVVYADDIRSSFEITLHLQSLNHREIWYIGNTKLPWFARSYSGYRRAMEHSGLQSHLSEIYSSNDEEVGYLGLKSILGRGEMVTAIFAGSDQIAEGVYRAAKENGLNIPDDLSVVGCNDTYGSMLQPQLTTITAFPHLLGRQLVEMVLSRIDQPERPPQQVTIPTEIIKRSSCQALKPAESHSRNGHEAATSEPRGRTAGLELGFENTGQVLPISSGD